MTASLTHARPRKPVRRPAALTAVPSRADLTRWAALRVELEETSASRGLPSDVTGARAMEAAALAGLTAVLEASRTAAS